MGKEQFFKEIIGILRQKELSKEDISRVKIRLCSKHGLKRIPNDFEILLNAGVEDSRELKQLQTSQQEQYLGLLLWL